MSRYGVFIREIYQKSPRCHLKKPQRIVTKGHQCIHPGGTAECVTPLLTIKRNSRHAHLSNRRFPRHMCIAVIVQVAAAGCVFSLAAWVVQQNFPRFDPTPKFQEELRFSILGADSFNLIQNQTIRSAVLSVVSRHPTSLRVQDSCITQLIR